MRIQIADDPEHEEVFAEIIDDSLSDWAHWAQVTHEQGRYYLEVTVDKGRILKFDFDEVIATLQKAKARLCGEPLG